VRELVIATPLCRGGRIPALALTAYAGAEDRQKALAAGFDTHVPKPAAPAELVAKVALLVG
jgi:CheY-like chemotaxis protein